jgi:uncharacterized protein (TIGR03083 family)
MNDVYDRRLDALEQTWAVWARLGAGMSEEQWSKGTRCDGWDVAALYAHHSVFPRALTALPPLADGPAGEPVTAADMLRQFNAPDGVAHTMADTVADAAAEDAAQHATTDLVDRFAVHGRQALQSLRDTEATTLVPWPAAGLVITLVEGLRIVLLEATVHLLDLQRALDQPPDVPAIALRDTAQLLAELAPAVELIEAAAGRSAASPFPVLR